MFDPELLLTNGYEARREGRLEDAKDLFVQAVAEARYSQDRSLLAKSLKALAHIERDLQHRGTAIKYYREAAAIHRDLGDPLAWAHAIRHVADIQREQSNLAEAEAAYLEALAVYRRHPDAPVLDHANALRGFALLKDKAGDLEEALLMWQGARTLYEIVGIEAGIAECASHIAFLLGH